MNKITSLETELLSEPILHMILTLTDNTGY